MEILQVIVGPPAARLLAQDFPSLAALAPLMHLRQVAEKEARSLDQCPPRAVAVRWQRIDPGLDIGEVRPEQLGHVGVKPPAVGHRRLRVGAPACALA